MWAVAATWHHRGVNHADATGLFGDCACGCHQQRAGGPCWCRDVRLPDPYEISHNDRVRYLNGCQCRGRACEWRTTSPENARALRRREEDDRDRRIRSGRPTGSDIHYLATHPHRYPQYFRRTERPAGG